MACGREAVTRRNCYWNSTKPKKKAGGCPPARKVKLGFALANYQRNTAPAEMRALFWVFERNRVIRYSP